jgi:type I restriction enzyme M protein
MDCLDMATGKTDKMAALTAALAAQMQEAAALDPEIKIQCAKVGFDMEGVTA